MVDFAQTFKFVEVCPDVRSRGDIREFPSGYISRVKEIMTSPYGRGFKSIYLYDHSYGDYYKKHGKVRGYTGTVWARDVVIDFDDDDSVENARLTTEAVVRKLVFELGVEEECIEVGFTGNRGFHITFPQTVIGFGPSEHMSDFMAAFLSEVVKGCTLPTTKFDKSIYRLNGLIRIPGSRHEETGLYKISLTVREFIGMTMDQIKEMAKTRRPRPSFQRPAEVNPALAVLWPATIADAHKVLARDRIKKVLPVLGNPAGNIPGDQRMCIQTMLREDLADGRKSVLHRIASHFVHQGTPTDVVLGICGSWNKKLTNPLTEDEFTNSVTSALQQEGGYYYGCHDTFLAERCDTRCFKYKDEVAAKDDTDYLQDIKSVGQVYINVLKQGGFIGFGLDVLNFHARGIAPGEVAFEVACSGVGKTTLMLYQALQIRKITGRPVLILEQELHEFLIFEKLAALTLQKGSADLEAAFTVCKDKKDYRDFEALMRDVEERYEGIYFVTLSELTTKRKIELITAAKRKYGDIAVVFEDYLGMGRETGQNMAEITTRLAKGTKDAAKTCSIPIISMVQARAEGGLDPSTPLDHNSMRDSRTIYIAGDCVFGFWRPFFGKSGLDTKIRGRTLKTRRGVEWKDFQLDWNRSFGSFSTDHDFDGIPGEDAVESKPPAAVG